MQIAMMRALSTRVLCVAVRRVEGAWCAYCDAVPGHSHTAEAERVARDGDKLPEHVARAVFAGYFDGVPYAV